MQIIGSGIFSWCSSERQTGRYGTFFLAPTDFAETAREVVHLDVGALRALEGRRVRVTLRVVRSRPSGHAGDQFLKVFPGDPPPAGSVVELAVGRLFLVNHEEIPAHHHPTRIGIGIAPADGRSLLWLDPAILYLLHDQSVELQVEETADPDTPPSPHLHESVEDGVIVNRDGTSFQLRGEAFRSCEYITLLPEAVATPGGITLRPTRPVPGERVRAVPGLPRASGLN